MFPSLNISQNYLNEYSYSDSKKKRKSNSLNYIFDNPFKQIQDEDIYLIKDDEKKKKSDYKNMAKNSKIWEKKTAGTRHGFKKTNLSDIYSEKENEKEIHIYNSYKKYDLKEKQKKQHFQLFILDLHIIMS